MVKMLARTAVTAPMVAHSPGGQVGADDWQAALVPHLIGLSIGLLVHPPNMAAGFSTQESEANVMYFMT